VDSKALIEAIKDIEAHGQRGNKIVMAPDVYKTFLKEFNMQGQFDIATTKDVLNGGVVGTIWGIEVTVSSLLPPGKVWVLPAAVDMFTTPPTFEIPTWEDTAIKDTSPPVNPHPLEGPFGEIRYIEEKTGKAFDDDLEYLLTLEPVGAAHLVLMHEHIEYIDTEHRYAYRPGKDVRGLWDKKTP